MPVRVKICGITNADDARAAVDYGADALGFIFVPDTPRYVGSGIYAAGDAFAQCPPYVSRVFVCKSLSDSRHGPAIFFDTVQYYDNDMGFHPEPPTVRRYVRAFRMRDESTLDAIAYVVKNAPPNALLLDTYHNDKLGGSGETFNWELAVEAKKRFGLPVILAGGLTPENVAEAVATVQPYAVDVSSGVEAEPGRKDHAKLRAFLKVIRAFS